MQKGSKRSEESIKKFMTTTVRKWLDLVDDDELLHFFRTFMKDRIKKALDAEIVVKSKQK